MPPPLLIAAGLRVATAEALPPPLQAYFRPAEGTAVVFLAVPVAKRSKNSLNPKERFVLVTQHHVLVLTAKAEVKRWLTIRALRRVLASSENEVCLQQNDGAHAHDLLFTLRSQHDSVAMVRALVLLFRDGHNGTQDVPVHTCRGAFSDEMLASLRLCKKPEEKASAQPPPPRLMVWSQQEWKKKGVNISAADAKTIERNDAQAEAEQGLTSPQSEYVTAARVALEQQRAVEAAWHATKHFSDQLAAARQKNDTATAVLNEKLQQERVDAIADARAQDEVTAANQKEISDYRQRVSECDDRVAALNKTFHDTEHAHIHHLSELEAELTALVCRRNEVDAQKQSVLGKPLLHELQAHVESLEDDIARAQTKLATIAPDNEIRAAKDAIRSVVAENKQLEETVLELMEEQRVMKHKADLSDAVIKSEQRREKRASKKCAAMNACTDELTRVTAEARQHAARLTTIAHELQTKGNRIAAERSVLDTSQ